MGLNPIAITNLEIKACGNASIAGTKSAAQPVQGELEKDGNPSFVVCKWLGNNEATATKHYLRVVSDEFYERAVQPKTQAAQNQAQHLHAEGGTESQDNKSSNSKSPVLQGLATECTGVQ